MQDVHEILSSENDARSYRSKIGKGQMTAAAMQAVNTWVSFCMAALYSELDSLVNGLKLICHRWLCRMYLYHRQEAAFQH